MNSKEIVERIIAGAILTPVQAEMRLLSYHFGCPEADQAHEEDPRVFAFYSSHPLPVAHFSKAFENLSLENRFGIIAHEMGHYIDDIRVDTETITGDPEIDADIYAERSIHIRIYYDRNKIQWAKMT